MTAAPDGPVERVLRWAAAPATEWPEGLEIDEEMVDRLVAAVDAHALGSRLAARLAANHRRPVPPRLSAAVVDLVRRDTAAAALQRAAIGQLRDHLRDPDSVVLIKGFSAFDLTTDSETLRTGDIDLVCASGAAHEIIRALRDLGYRRTRDAFQYELGEFTRGRGEDMVEIDLHEYYPINSYDDLLRGADLRAGAGVDLHVQPGRLREARLTHSMLRDGTGARGPYLPSTAAAALVLSAHAFLNFTNLWSISHRQKPYVRLGELADIRALVRSPQFDAHRFDDFVDRQRGQDCVRWVSWMSSVVIGVDPFAGHRYVAEEDVRFPRCVWWDIWVDVPELTPTLLQENWYSVDALVRALACPSAPVEPPGVRIGFADHACRFVMSNRLDGIPSDWAVRASERDDSLDVEVHAGVQPASGVTRVRVDFGRPAFEWHVEASGETGLAGAAVPVTIEVVGGRRRVTFHVPRATLTTRDGKLPVLVGVASCPANGTPPVTAVLAANLQTKSGRAT